MLFADRTVVRQLEQFECAWESLRPVPRVHIDFGDGHTLDRTLHGNIAFWFVTPQGEAFDVVPGLVDAPTLLARCREAVELARALARTPDPLARRALVEDVHRLRLSAAARDGGSSDAATARDLSKRLVELPLEAALLRNVEGDVAMPRPVPDPAASAASGIGAPSAAPAPPAPDVRKRLVEAPIERALAVHADPPPVPDHRKLEVEAPVEAALAARPVLPAGAESPELLAPSGLPDVSKLAVELPLESALGAHAARDTGSLLADTEFNARVRFPQADRLLLAHPLAPPAALTQRLYAEVLGVDLSDPWLGLAPLLPGGEPGRDGAGLPPR